MNQSSLFLPPLTRIAHTIALLVHDYYAIYDLTSTPLVYSIHHTILVMTISCIGQSTSHRQTYICMQYVIYKLVHSVFIPIRVLTFPIVGSCYSLSP